MDPRPFLSGLRRRLWTVLIADGAARTVGWTLVVICAAILLDRLAIWIDPLQPLPGSVRLPLLLIVLATAGSLAWRRLIRPLQRSYDHATLARIAERRIPEFDGRLLSAVEGLDLGERDRRSLAEICAGVRLQRILRTDGMARAVTGTLLLLLAVGGLAAVHWSFVSTGLQRLFLPLGSAEWDRSHHLQAELEHAVVPADEPLVVAADGEGSSARMRMAWRSDDGMRDTRVPEALTGPWRERLKLPVGSYRIELTWGDALPVELAGRVVDRPGLRQATATIVPPAYVGSEPEVVDTPSGLALLAGSTVRLDLELSVEDPGLSERTVEAFLNGEPVAITATESGYRLEQRIVEGGELGFTLRDRYQDAGREVVADPAPVIPLRVLADRAPFVRLSGPARNEAVTPQAQIDLLVTATDDYGLASLDLGAEVIGPEGETRSDGSGQLAAWPGVAGVRGETRREHRLRVGEHAEIGEQLVLMATAHDANDVTGPGIGSSDPLTLRVVSREQLRQELDRVLGEIRDRVVQARDQLAPGLTDEERLTGAARGSRPVAERAAEQLVQVERRWRANALDEADAEVLARARAAIAEQAVPQLRTAAAEQATAPALAADEALGEAERAITRLLRSDDLARELSNLRSRQAQLSEATREVVRQALSGELAREEAERQLGDLARRQREVADQLREWTQRLLSEDSDDLAEARALAREQQPAAALERAAKALGGDSEQRALADQNRAEETMDELLDLLRGDENEGELSDLAGELAARQERIQDMLEAGADPADMQEAQERLDEDTEELRRRLESETDNAEAQEAVEGARDAQQDAQEAMQQGDSSGAAREAGAAAAQLRQAQRELDPDRQDQEQGEQQEQDEQNPVTDVLALLRRLHREQTGIVTVATRLNADGVGADGEPIENFGQRRQVLGLAEREEAVLLELEADALEAVQEMPVVMRALGRVRDAVGKAHEHLAEPALGERGERLTEIALYELARLIEIVDTMPSPEQSNQEGNSGGGGGSQAPFPPAAQLALLAAEQRDLRARTAARFPGELAAAQNELLELAALVGRMTRPGSRPNVLMQRTVRAMASSTDLLEHAEFGPTTLSEQDLAADLLLQVLKEAEGSSGGGGGSSSSGQQQQQRGQQNQSRPSEGDQGEESEGEPSGAAQDGGQASGNEAPEGETTRVLVEVERAEWMHLPPQARAKLQEAFEDNVPPEALDLYRSYLEQLEGARE